MTLEWIHCGAVSAGRMAGAAALLGAVLLGSSGCFTSRYVTQAACGELGILAAARPIPAVVGDERTPPRIRRLLSAVPAIERFGRTQGLRPTDNYRSYADLHREAAVWVVEACAPLAFETRWWKFPVVGSVPYLGFFHEDAAREYATELAAKEGLDVAVRTAGAYSTLGWFHDPVLSTMIPEGPEALGELANAVLHESVHATLYVDDQSTFDESLASFVADRLAAEWLERAVGPDASESRAYAASLRWQREVGARLHEAYVQLDALYRSARSEAQKLTEKARILGGLRAELRLRDPLNNAALMDYETYGAGAAALERLLGACDGSWPRFLSALRRVRFPRPQETDLDRVIAPLVRAGCAAPRS